ncbi:MAG: hypothetical protein LBD42_01680 [Desulfovibrio sp.]|jgi:hypothetical protein|nr:hypothetical protein [Desulfovibrio sp.]
MNALCLYGIAAACLAWGVLGLRFSLSVLAANTVLAALFLVALPAFTDNGNLLYALILAYPLYWGAAFLSLRFVERANLPALNIPLRFSTGCAAALFFIAWANGDFFIREGKQFHLTYFVQPQERAARLAAFLQESDEKQRCGASYATLMTLAVNARDKDVTRVFLNELAACDGAAATISGAVKPVLDGGDTSALDFLLQCGMAPDTEVFGHDYANGTALAYAAAVAGNPELVRLIAASAPERARGMKYLNTMIRTLEEQDNREILTLLARMGISQESGSSP